MVFLFLSTSIHLHYYFFICLCLSIVYIIYKLYIYGHPICNILSFIQSAERKIRHIQKYATLNELIRLDESIEIHSLGDLHGKMIKSLAALNLYIIRGEHKKAQKIALDLFRTASRYQAPKYIHESARFLSTYYTSFEFNRKKALKYANAERNSKEAFIHECELISIRNRIILAKRSPHSRKNFNRIFRTHWERIEMQLERIKSWEFNRLAYILGCQYYYNLGDQEKLLHHAEAAIEYLENFHMQSNQTLAILYKYKLGVLATNKLQFNDSDFIIKYNSVVKKGTTNWFNFKFTLCRIRLNQLKPLESSIILHEVNTNKNFTKIPDANQVNWKILTAYQNFYELCSPDFKNPRRFKIGKLLNETDSHQLLSDAEIMSLSIIKLSFYMLDKKTLDIEKSAFAIDKHMTRIKLRIKDKRTYTFVKMLLAIPNYQYHPNAINRHTLKFYKKLSQLQPNKSLHFENSEIIPYERLWEMIMDNLKR